MSKEVLVIVVLAALFIAESQSCSSNNDCDTGACCFGGICTTSSYLCDTFKSCYSDFDCTNGCCHNSRCRPQSSYWCIKGNGKSCNYNWDCDSLCCRHNTCHEMYSSVCHRTVLQTTASSWCYSDSQCSSGCCKDNTCQASYFHCHSTTRSQCYANWQCSGYDCCVNGQCGDCQYATTESPDDYYDSYNNHDTTTEGTSDDDYDYDGYTHRKSSSGMSMGAYIGIAVASVVVVILKVTLWASWCQRRNQRVIMVRRRITCVTVPIVESDELQREYERTDRGISDRLPPAYSPRPFEHVPQNETEGLPLISGERQGEGAPIGPPPAYSPNPVDNPTTHPDQNTGNTEETNGVPQVSTVVPPPAYTPSIAVDPAAQNSSQTDQTQRREAAGHTNQMNDASQEETMGPFII